MAGIRTLLFSIFLPLISHGQSHHAEFWGTVNVTHHFNKHWFASIDLHHKTQNDFYSNDKNIFHYRLSNGVRTWIRYKMKDNWELALSPFGWFENDDLIGNCSLTKHNELRFTTGVIKGFDIGKVKNNNRLLLEMRQVNYNNGNDYPQIRYRLQNSLAVNLFSTSRGNGLKYIIYNELILRSQNHFFGIDQDRVGNALQYKLYGAEILCGYQFTAQKIVKKYTHHEQMTCTLNLVW